MVDLNPGKSFYFQSLATYLELRRADSTLKNWENENECS